MQIKQIQVSADGLQDRLLLRIATGNNEEVRVFVTRRFLKELWPALVGMLFGHLGAAAAPASQPGNPPGSFDQPYQNDNPVLPLGATPLLPAEGRVEPAGPGLCRITLREPRERSLAFNLNASLLQALCAMLRTTAETAHWDLALDYALPSTPIAAADLATRKHLH